MISGMFSYLLNLMIDVNNYWILLKIYLNIINLLIIKFD
jgi:hypothetical protein